MQQKFYFTTSILQCLRERTVKTFAERLEPSQFKKHDVVVRSTVPYVIDGVPGQRSNAVARIFQMKMSTVLHGMPDIEKYHTTARRACASIQFAFVPLRNALWVVHVVASQFCHESIAFFGRKWGHADGAYVLPSIPDARFSNLHFFFYIHDTI